MPKINKFLEPESLQQQALELVARHLQEIQAKETPLSPTDGNIVQNYLKVFIMLNKDSRDALERDDPKRLSDQELLQFAQELAKGTSHDTQN